MCVCGCVVRPGHIGACGGHRAGGGRWELPDVGAGDQIWGLCKSCFHSVTELSFLSLGF